MVVVAEIVDVMVDVEACGELIGVNQVCVVVDVEASG